MFLTDITFLTRYCQSINVVLGVNNSQTKRIWFSLATLKLIRNCFSNRKQRTKINSSYSSWHEIIFGAPQASILGQQLFNIFLIALFFIVEDIDIANCADVNTPYINANNINKIIHCLEKVTDTIFKWFSDNLMKSNSDGGPC